MANEGSNPETKYLVAVIGAGPAGLFASKALTEAGAEVVLLNRDIKPGGLAEYGIYHDKHKMKEGLRRQFFQILGIPEIDYMGNVTVGAASGLRVEDLQALGFQAVLVTVGAQGTKWLGLPGEDLAGVYHAKDLVYHYNRLPPFSQREYMIGRRAALVGVGNVMIDLAHWLIRDLKIEEVVAVARRGPAEVKFTKKELESVLRNLDVEALEAEIGRCAPVMEAVGQDPKAALDYILSPLPKSLEPNSVTRFTFDFLASPTRILGDEDGRVRGLEVEDTTLVPFNGDSKARGLGTFRVLDVDTVIFCIGDRVDEAFGLPVYRNEFVKNPAPLYPVDGLSFEAFDPDRGEPLDGVFVAGWAREASSGLVGVARKDGETGARAVVQYLQAQRNRLSLPEIENRRQKLVDLIGLTGKPVISKEDVFHLTEIEKAEAARRGVEEYKLQLNEEMLEALGLRVR